MGGRAKENEDDCPYILIKKARTRWQKLVASAFVEEHEVLIGIKNDVKWQKWLITSIFLVMLGILIKIIFKF